MRVRTSFEKRFARPIQYGVTSLLTDMEGSNIQLQLTDKSVLSNANTFPLYCINLNNYQAASRPFKLPEQATKTARLWKGVGWGGEGQKKKQSGWYFSSIGLRHVKGSRSALGEQEYQTLEVGQKSSDINHDTRVKFQFSRLFRSQLDVFDYAYFANDFNSSLLSGTRMSHMLLEICLFMAEVGTLTRNNIIFV